MSITFPSTRLRSSTAYAVLVRALCAGLAASTASADWTHLAADSAKTGGPSITEPTIGDELVQWSRLPATGIDNGVPFIEEFINQASPVTDGTHLIVVARVLEDTFNDGLLIHTQNRVICYDAETGLRLWDASLPPDLDDSWSSPALDTLRQQVIVATDRELFALSLSDGATHWQRTLPRPVVNASPTVSRHITAPSGAAADRVLITDFSGLSSNASLYAINLSAFDAIANPFQPGEIAWSEPISGGSGNTPAIFDDHVYVASSVAGEVFSRAIYDGALIWQRDPGISGIGQLAGFYGGLSVTDDAVFLAGYEFFGAQDSSRLYKLSRATGNVLWSVPCERTASIPILRDDLVLLSGGIAGFGSIPKLQVFRDLGSSAIKTDELTMIGGWNHHVTRAGHVGTPADDALFPAYAQLQQFTLTPTGTLEHIATHTGSGGPVAITQSAGTLRTYSIGVDGLFAFETAPLAGDLNCDGVVNTSDIDPFVAALLDPAAYASQFPSCDRDRADLNADGNINTSDIDPFVAKLLGA